MKVPFEVMSFYFDEANRKMYNELFSPEAQEKHGWTEEEFTKELLQGMMTNGQQERVLH